MHAGDIIERLRDSYPARQHSNIGNEAGISHELVALAPWVASEHPQFSLIWDEPENCVECGGLACAVGTDESEDAALFHTQIDAIQRDRRAENLAEAASFYACHGFSASPSCGGPARWISRVRHPQTTGWLLRSGVLPLSGRAAE